jgi:hypothetical protein
MHRLSREMSRLKAKRDHAAGIIILCQKPQNIQTTSQSVLPAVLLVPNLSPSNTNFKTTGNRNHQLSRPKLLFALRATAINSLIIFFMFSSDSSSHSSEEGGNEMMLCHPDNIKVRNIETVVFACAILVLFPGFFLHLSCFLLLTLLFFAPAILL